MTEQQPKPSADPTVVIGIVAICGAILGGAWIMRPQPTPPFIPQPLKVDVRQKPPMPPGPMDEIMKDIYSPPSR
jgi:hypothetical protein